VFNPNFSSISSISRRYFRNSHTIK